MNQSVKADQFRVTSIPYNSNGYVIFSGMPIKKNSYKTNNGKYFISIKIVSDLLPVMPAVGQHWTVEGKRTIKDVTVGDYLMKQHSYESPNSVSCNLPETGEQIIKFIAKEKDFKGIGESKARELWQLLGEDFHYTMRNDTPETRKLLRKVLKEVSIDAIFNGYAKYKNLSACNWMSDHKIPAQIQQRIIKHHDQKTVDAIRANPYLLLGFGMRFVDVDAIASILVEVDKFQSNPHRLSAAVEMGIRNEIDKGHTYTTQARLHPIIKKILNQEKLVAEAFKVSHGKTQYIKNKDKGTYHPTAQYLMESVVVKRLLALDKLNNLYDDRANSAYTLAVNELPYELTRRQSEAVMTTLDNSISCITGGAGTGKTTVLRTALRAYKQMGFEIYAVALSGRAAMRLNESIGLKTITIAAFLRQEPIEPSGGQSKHLLVIDESSMIDLPTIYRLVIHLHPSVRIILTGDPDQLPPIGCGKVLADIVKSKVIANTMLDIVKRQEGSTGIPEYSKLINEGIVPENINTGAITFHQTFKDKIAEVCTKLFQSSPANSRIIGGTRAMVAEINNLTQNAVNSDGERLEFELHGEKFFRDLRKDDAILFTKNNYDKGIQNGSLGVLSSVESTGDSYGTVVLDTGDSIEITEAVLDCMELGYGITLHKAQGSQFPRIIIALQKGRIVDRAWLYTAITRAEIEIHIVGSEKDFREIIKLQSNAQKRNSYLHDLLIMNKCS